MQNPVGISRVVPHIEGKTECAYCVSSAVLEYVDLFPSYTKAMILWNPVGISHIAPHIEGKPEHACDVSIAMQEYVDHFPSYPVVMIQ